MWKNRSEIGKFYAKVLGMCNNEIPEYSTFSLILKLRDILKHDLRT